MCLQVLDSWAHLAIAAVTRMDPAAVKRSILPFALARAADKEMGAQGRMLAAALLAAAAGKLPKSDAEHVCLPKALLLCQVSQP